MRRYAVLSALAMLCAFVPAAGAEKGKTAVEIPPSTWVEAKVTFVPPADIPDAGWSTTDGYCAATYRSKTGTILWRTGVQSKKAGLSPGFYSNATLEWAPATDGVTVVNLSRHWGGGSDGGGKLLEGYPEGGEPTPRHTYDGITYVPELDAMYLMIGANWRIGARNATDQARKEHARDANCTWKYAFKEARWIRIADSIRRFWPSQYEVSPYEAHMQHWPEGGKLLFLNDRGSHYATFDLKTEKWTKGELKNKCPMSLYNARSTWDAKRGLWVFRLGPNLCTFDPARSTFAALPAPYEMPEDKTDPRRASKGVAYIDKHDAYLIAGPTGNDTYAFSPATAKWTPIPGGELKMVNGYMQYDPKTDLTVMVYQHRVYRFHYVP